MFKYSKTIKQISLLFFFIVAFVLGYALAMFKLSVKASADKNSQNINQPLQDKSCAPKPQLSFKQILGKPTQSTQSVSRQPRLLNDKPLNVSVNSSLPDGAINSLGELKQFLTTLDVNNFDIDSVRDYLNTSSEAFQFLISQYAQLQDAEKKGLLLDLISETDNPDKAAFAQELVNASDVNERKRAYSWLADSEQNNASQNVLLNASYYEENPAALGDIVSALSVVDLDSQMHASAVTRLSELSFHENPDVAAHAISVVSGISQDPSTLTMLNSHINSANENLKIAALNGLYYFDGTNSETRDSVSRLLNDSSASETVKEIAGELMTVWVQNQKVNEGNVAEAEDAYYDDLDN